ncbi:MAG TPA: endonuclease Q family protein [Candidatus Saccharimonadales bacterium]|nr:endonuclease Q family protein [Candidatus Saccharimonadales bacterium]
MELIVDLHVHSHYSRATSKDCTIEGLYRWGKIKGINIIGTGDFTHPGWLAEIQEKLEPTEGGLYQLKDDIARIIDASLPQSVRNNLIRFIPTVEIATIYSKGGKVRKLHQLVVMPGFTGVSELNARLDKIGNLKADGRPILGLDSKELLRHALESDPEALYIPAHIWTPWFGMFGSKSGFDSIQEAFEELAPEIRAIETGLSSDPAMNRGVSNLDGVTITSHSDAHSPQKLGREATIIEAKPTYDDIIEAIKSNDKRVRGTIEFFPEEGKYHSDGHRACGIRFDPGQTREHGGICPACHKPLVVGVQYRVGELTDTADAIHPKQVEYIVPLPEVLAELHGVKSVTSKAVISEYMNIIAKLGSEFDVLRKIKLDAVKDHSALIGMAIERIRSGQVHKEPGYDGVFGTIRVFKNAQDRAAMTLQISLL